MSQHAAQDSRGDCLVRVFIDSADLHQIERWLASGVADGVTTNPSIVLKAGVKDLEGHSRRIAELIGDRPLSVEVTTNDPELMLQQGRAFARWAPNIVVKIPVINEDGVPSLVVVNTLEREGIAVNVTACLSFGQAMLAAKAGATYVSLFWGRIGDEGHDPARVVRTARAWLDDWRYKAQIIVGSIRSTYDIQAAAEAGAHVITIPPEFLPKLVDHRYSRETVRQFVADAQRSIIELATKVGEP
jgi:transaldolase